MKKGDKILIFIILAILIIASINHIFLYNKSDDLTVLIYQNNELVGEYPFSNESTITLNSNESSDDFDYNIININNNNVTMIEATCSDELCVKTPSISRNQQSIVCLPNKVLVKLEYSNTHKNTRKNDNISDLTTG